VGVVPGSLPRHLWRFFERDCLTWAEFAPRHSIALNVIAARAGGRTLLPPLPPPQAAAIRATAAPTAASPMVLYLLIG
jgi:hypothetical protein